MQGKVIEWAVRFLLSKLDKDVAAEALVGLLRGACSAAKAVAVKTESQLDDQVVAKATEVVEALAVMLKVPLH